MHRLSCVRLIATLASAAMILLARPSAAATQPGDSVAFGPAEASLMRKIDRRSLAPGPAWAMPAGAANVNPARIAAAGWQHCALSFDDGPNEVTPRILEILDREHVTATYFPVAAAAAKHPEAVRAFVASGHEIGNHSLSHRNLARLDGAAQRADLDEANRILRSLGAQPALFRPPYGSYDDRLLETARAAGLETVLWSLDARDWQYRDANLIATRVKAGAGPALVVLLHATYGWTERALPQIIAALRHQGCRFVTLSAWLAFMHESEFPPAIASAGPPHTAVTASAATASAAPVVAAPTIPVATPKPPILPVALRATRAGTGLRIEGNDAFLELGPGADLNQIVAELKAALDRPTRRP